jgi:DNA replication protein DnaC
MRSAVDFNVEPIGHAAKNIVDRHREALPVDEEATADRQQQETERRQEMRRRREKEADLMRQVGRRYRDVKLESFRCQHPGQQNAIDDIHAYINTFPKANGGIVLFGPTGTGKDHLLIAAARAVILRYGYSVAWADGMTMYGDLRDLMGSEYSEKKFLNRLIAPALLIMSDPIPPRGILTDYQAAMLFRVLDARYRECRPTWASLNVESGKEGDDRIGPQLVDRLRDESLCIHCDWPSYRRPLEIKEWNK